MDRTIFKAYDIRGVYPRDFSEKDASIIAYEAASFVSAKRIAVGFDSRKGSSQIANSVSNALLGVGSAVSVLGLVGTCEFYYSVLSGNYDMGIMVTASHNPREYNGMKIVLKNAVPLGNDNGLSEIMERSIDYELHSPPKKGVLERKTFRKEFIDYSLSSGYAEPSKIRQMKIVVDASSGSMGPVLADFFSMLPAEVISLNFEPNGSFPSHGPNPLEEQSRELISKKVAEEGADLGIIFDGDGDRVFFIDEKGAYVPGDVAAALLGSLISARGKKEKILYDLRSTRFFPDMVSKSGGIPIMCRVGHAFIKKQMREEKASFAGELSGHYYYRIKNAYFENSLISCLQIMQLVSEQGALSALAAKNPYFSSGEKNFEAAEKEHIISEIEKMLSKEPLKKVSRLDGLSMEFGSWRFNIRASNTEALLRLNVEADSREMLAEKLEMIGNKIKEESAGLLGKEQ
jgi:phosphomannomutase